MRWTCYFDAGDICCHCENGVSQYGHVLIQAIDKGEYILPIGVLPLGQTAEQLWPNALNLAGTVIV